MNKNVTGLAATATYLYSNTGSLPELARAPIANDSDWRRNYTTPPSDLTGGANPLGTVATRHAASGQWRNAFAAAGAGGFGPYSWESRLACATIPPMDFRTSSARVWRSSETWSPAPRRVPERNDSNQPARLEDLVVDVVTNARKKQTPHRAEGSLMIEGPLKGAIVSRSAAASNCS
jgi:hypothetical protein